MDWGECLFLTNKFLKGWTLAGSIQGCFKSRTYINLLSWG